MTQINCLKLNKTGEQLSRPPMPGKIGDKIYESISKEAWEMWLTQQTMLINEYRLNPMDPQARDLLLEKMQEFLFEKNQ